jgi:hypothetical protein
MAHSLLPLRMSSGQLGLGLKETTFATYLPGSVTFEYTKYRIEAGYLNPVVKSFVWSCHRSRVCLCVSYKKTIRTKTETRKQRNRTY